MHELRNIERWLSLQTGKYTSDTNQIMNIGSKVRLLHGKEEGIITKIKSGKYLEIDLGDGFSIPVLANEVVLISPEEKKIAPVAENAASFRPRPTAAGGAVASTAFVTKGIYFSFVPINDREVVLHLVNLTSWQLLFTIYGRTGANTKGLASGVLTENQSHQVTKLLLKDFESWPVFETHVLYYNPDRSPGSFILEHSLRCRIQSFHNQLQKAPLLGVNAHVYQIDASSPKPQSEKIEASEIRARMLDADDKVVQPPFQGRLPEQIDLHLAALKEEAAGLSNAAILELQLTAFKNYLEQAIAGGLAEITIIHGVGQGTLRQEIHRLLSKHPNVANYKDAQKEKFGYGATIARLK